MTLVEHRVNTREHLARVPRSRGIEIDIRDCSGELVCVHGPFQKGEPLEHLLAGYDHALAIFNVKCDGLERQISELARRNRIQDYFFLDVANPTLVSLVRGGEKRVAVRFSEYEPIEFALAFRGRVEWVWVDCFTHLPLSPEKHARLQEHFKICLVSPELQGHPREKIREFREQLQGLPVDAVCSDFCDDWSCA
jgi:hypothetical protein